MSEITLEIDYREKSVIKLIEEYKEFPFKYNISNLIIGDFVIKQDDEILYILERKTIMDLSASITDGRFREQKQRLFESVNGCFDKIIYIIEGNKNLKKYGSISKTTINSSIVNLLFKHKYKVLHTTDEKDTLEQMIQISLKLQKGEFDKPIKTDVKIIKKGDNKNPFSNMLCTIPGVSTICAEKIKDKYTSLSNLFDEYKLLTNIENKYELLADIQVNKRKIGKALSKKIYCYLFNEKVDKDGDKDNDKDNDNDNDNEECLL